MARASPACSATPPEPDVRRFDVRRFNASGGVSAMRPVDSAFAPELSVGAARRVHGADNGERRLETARRRRRSTQLKIGAVGGRRACQGAATRPRTTTLADPSRRGRATHRMTTLAIRHGSGRTTTEASGAAASLVTADGLVADEPREISGRCAFGAVVDRAFARPALDSRSRGPTVKRELARPTSLATPTTSTGCPPDRDRPLGRVEEAPASYPPSLEKPCPWLGHG